MNKRKNGAAEELVEAVIENLEEEYSSGLEPFEAYANRIRLKIFENLEIYRERYQNGYEVLLEELKKDYPEAEK